MISLREGLTATSKCPDPGVGSAGHGWDRAVSLEHPRWRRRVEEMSTDSRASVLGGEQRVKEGSAGPAA